MISSQFLTLTMRFGISILLVFVLVSCSDLTTSDFESKVEALITKTDSLEEQNRNIKIENLTSIQIWSDSLDKKIRQLFKPVPYEVGKQIVAFTELRQNLAPFKTSDSLITSYLTSSKTQLIHLKSDIANGSGKRTMYEKHIIEETAKLDSLSFEVIKRDSVGKSIIATFNELQSSLESNLNDILLKE